MTDTPFVIADWETKSTADLKKTGSYLYARHPDTRIVCLPYSIGYDEPRLWLPGGVKDWLPEHIAAATHTGDDMPPDLRAAAENPECEFWAHNAPFDAGIWWHIARDRLGWPDVPMDRWHCLAATAANLNLPRSLEAVGEAIGLSQKKDVKAGRVLKQVMKPRRIEPDGTIVWWDESDAKGREKLITVYEYALQDVRTEQEEHRKLKRMSPRERKVFLMDWRINQRGVQVDVQAVKRAVRFVEDAKRALDADMAAATRGGVLSVSNHGALSAWLNGQGVETDGVSKDAVKHLLERDDLPADVRRVLEIRREGAKSSTAKYPAFLARVDEHGRMRDNLMYYGASQTGRWSGVGVQLQNLMRPEAHDANDAIPDLALRASDFALLWGPPMSYAADMVRGMIVAAPGKYLIVRDFSNIEGRMAAYIAGEQWKLQAFRDFDAGTGHDLYALAYAKSFGITPEAVMENKKTGDGKMRQVGKVMELSMGFGGGVGAFQAMAANYGVVVADDEADTLKVAWREAHPAFVAAWRAMEDAAFAALRAPCAWHPGAGDCALRFHGGHLWLRLPSKRVLCLPFARVKKTAVPWSDQPRDQIHYRRVDQKTRQWVEAKTYGGDLFQSAVQATARDVMVSAMWRLEQHPAIEIVLTCHDEILAEAKEEVIEECDKFMRETMDTPPSWATGLPISTDGFVSRRYRK